MPNIKSQKDRMRLTAKQTAHNKAIKTNLKSTIKKANASIEANADDKDVAVKNATIALEKAASKGLIHQKNASRKISRMMQRANAAH